MRGTRALLGALLAAALAVGGLSGCQTVSGAARDRPSGRATSPAPSGFGAEFLAVDECSSFGTTSFSEVPCTSERAAARVVARYDGDPVQGPACPATTDFVLHISPSGVVRRGYACMRNLEPPHPGDPGGGGGPRTIVGDCVYGAGKGEVRETACDGRGRRTPEYRVTSAVARRSQCPPSTALYVQLGGSSPVGCARRL
ncbi:hypothetical protein ACWEWG_27240 [Streptomyces sp. NPDC003758]|uniref:Lipoprotein n=1 Tax=Streptomyces cynarae TaxID=2981134 RepID=A0ABY6E1X7_9ACTN|nr:hypothetical protein [Streptomyces cynarae]UXY19928.1 hypothetical protein N8I84_15245 [Streptomyces cynarae]